MQVIILLLNEVIGLGRIFSVDGTRHIEAGITDRLQFTDLTQHGTDLTLRLIREVGITHILQILGNLKFHIIADALIFLNTGVELVEVLLVVLLLTTLTRREVKQFLHHAKHTLHTVGESLYLLLSLQHREFRRLHDTSRNEVQTEVFLLVHLLRLDNPAYKLLNLGDEPDQDTSVNHVEA